MGHLDKCFTIKPHSPSLEFVCGRTFSLLPPPPSALTPRFYVLCYKLSSALCYCIRECFSEISITQTYPVVFPFYPNISFISDTKGFCKFILYIFCLTLRMNHFSKELLFSIQPVITQLNLYQSRSFQTYSNQNNLKSTCRDCINVEASHHTQVHQP